MCFHCYLGSQNPSLGLQVFPSQGSLSHTNIPRWSVIGTTEYQATPYMIVHARPWRASALIKYLDLVHRAFSLSGGNVHSTSPYSSTSSPSNNLSILGRWLPPLPLYCNCLLIQLKQSQSPTNQSRLLPTCFILIPPGQSLHWVHLSTWASPFLWYGVMTPQFMPGQG